MKIEDKTPPVEKVFVLTLNEDELIALRSFAAHSLDLKLATGVRDAPAVRFLDKTKHLTKKATWEYISIKVFNDS